MSTHILIVEDDCALSAALLRSLQQEGYSTDIVRTLDEAREKTVKPSYDLVLLDWMLPDGQGIDFLREIRAREPGLPILVLTARTEVIDKVIGLETGANDYLTKPFEPRELHARIRAALRTREANSRAVASALAAGSALAAPAPSTVQATAPRPRLQSGGIALDPISREAWYDGLLIQTTKLEFDLLTLFLENPERVFPREALLNQIWGYDCYPTTRTVDNHIVQLRQKTRAELFETVRGVGYRFRGRRSDEQNAAT